jgi:hypothetical protein
MVQDSTFVVLEVTEGYRVFAILGQMRPENVAHREAGTWRTSFNTMVERSVEPRDGATVSSTVPIPITGWGLPAKSESRVDAKGR